MSCDQALVIYFALRLPAVDLEWWGNEVFQNTADAKGTPFRTTPEGGFGPAPKAA